MSKQVFEGFLRTTGYGEDGADVFKEWWDGRTLPAPPAEDVMAALDDHHGKRVRITIEELDDGQH